MDFTASLRRRWQTANTLVCVGLDPDPAKIPDHLRKDPHPLFAFNREIIDQTADLVCAYKPQIAYYAAAGAERDLELTIAHIHDHHPGIPVILDAKRGDIGSTAAMYAAEAFERYAADAVTVNPYMGTDTLAPFLERADKGVIVLCRTSNPGSGDFQSLAADGRPLYQHVAQAAADRWNANANVALVVGATYPQELGEVRAIIGDIPLLVPGIGAQGGDIEQAVTNGRDSAGAGMMINSSRGIIYAGTGVDFAAASRQATLALRDAINAHR
jgi:orotidine-5'-phosphate decarboxylase